MKNLQVVESVKQLADKKGCTPGQLALAWVHSQVVSWHCRVPGASLHKCPNMNVSQMYGSMLTDAHYGGLRRR